VLVVFPARIKPLAPAAMAHEHPDAPQQFSVRLPNETMGLVTQIQGFRRRINQPTTLSAIVKTLLTSTTPDWWRKVPLKTMISYDPTN
jgi:hypothetical protein